MIFGPAFKLEIVPLKPEYSYNEPIEYKVILDVKKDKEIKQLKTSLKVYVKGTSICWYEEEDEEEGGVYSREETFFFVLKEHEETLLEKTKPGKGKHEFTVKVPPLTGMPVPGEYKFYKVEWRILAEIPGFMRKTKAETLVNVKRPTEAGPMEDSEYRGGDIIVSAKIPQYIPLGGAFKASLKLLPKTGLLDCKEIKVELVNKLHVRKRDIDPTADQCEEPKHEATYSSKVVGKDIKMSQEEPFSTEITLEVPSDGYPSFKHHDSGSEWFMVISCKKGFMRSDKVEIPLIVI